MPEPDYNQGDPPGFWWWAIGLFLLFAVAALWTACR